MEFPPNSRKQAEPKRIEQVTSASAIRKKRGLGKQFRSTFIGGDAQSASAYVLLNVVIPTAREALAEMGTSFIEKLIYGDSRPRRGGAGPLTGGQGYISYNRMSAPGRPPAAPQAISRASRARHNFDELVIPTRQEAEEVIDRLYDLISKYESVTVADLYELTGVASSHQDHKWGWEDLTGAGVGRVRGGGYVLNLPEPQSLD